mgnify:CR=1 FL=1
MVDQDILVLGGGPAGAVTAIALQQLGYRVTLVTEPRPFAAVEGISARVWQALRQAGLISALAQVQPPSPRRVCWNGVDSHINEERLVERRRFDSALLEDLRAWGVTVVEGRVEHNVPDAARPWARVCTVNGVQTLSAAFMVEARGRAAPAAGTRRLHGPATLAIVQRWYGPARRACSAVGSLDIGWGWMAALPSGERYVQLMVDSQHTCLPAKEQLGEWSLQHLRRLPYADLFLEQARPLPGINARISTPVLQQELVGTSWIRIGDAAMAVDPLSGNGIFQSLSSALQAPAVINTLLQRPSDRALAIAFYQRRVEELFLRFARIGRDFCRQEQRWSDQAFWQSRARWPDEQPVHDMARRLPAITVCPVVDQYFIRNARVVTTADHPQGIWHLNGVELAPLLDELLLVTDAGIDPQLLWSQLLQMARQASRSTEAVGFQQA